MTEICTSTYKLGANRGRKCDKPATKNGLCDYCAEVNALPSCTYVLKNGPYRGQTCNRAVVKDERCDLCLSRETLTANLLKNYSGPEKCKNDQDPYNFCECAGEGERPAVFNGYCLLCLSGY